MDDKPYTAKQCIVMRKDLNMRKGKMIAQGAHGSCAWMANTVRLLAGKHTPRPVLTKAEEEWLTGRFTKVCVYVNSEEELRKVHEDAMHRGMRSVLIEDAGFTEFGGVVTLTCCAIGPDWNHKIDMVTGQLPLL